MKVGLLGAGRIGVLHASVLAGDPGVDEILAGDADPQRTDLGHFLSLARGEAENPCTTRDALEALKVAMAADRLLAERRPIAISEVE